MTSSVFPRSAAAQKTQFKDAYEVLESGIREHAFPGAAFGVLHKGEVVALDGVGHFIYLEEAGRYPGLTPEPVTPFTIYDLASLTKVTATTAAAMLLYDRGRLDLEEPVGDILPGFVVGAQPGSGKARVTLRMLLAHSSGLPAHARLFEAYSTPPEVLRACLRLPLDALPGTRVEYSDIGFILLGLALEVLSGRKLAGFCEREIFEPLGMKSTCFRPPSSWRAEIPPTEDDRVFRRRVIQGEVHDENCSVLGGASGHAGLFSDPGDVLRYAACILDDGGKLFRRETVDLFATRQDLPPGSSRALGWDTPSEVSSAGRFFSASSIGHLGFTGTSLWIDRERELAVVLLTNRTWPQPSEFRTVIRRTRPAFHDAIFARL